MGDPLRTKSLREYTHYHISTTKISLETQLHDDKHQSCNFLVVPHIKIRTSTSNNDPPAVVS